MYLVYKSDKQHSYASLDLIAVCSNKDQARDMIVWKAQKEGETLTEDDNHCLENYKQTQGYKGKGEFLYQEIPVNVLL